MLSMNFIENKEGMKKRISNILSVSKKYSGKICLGLIVVCVAIIGAFVGCTPKDENEENEIELGFKTKKIARNFVKVTSRLSIIYREDRTRYSMQLIADILKKLTDSASKRIVCVELFINSSCIIKRQEKHSHLY